MSNYIKATDFAAKDSLASGSPAKVIKGTEINTEFNAIQTAIASKADLNSPAFSGTPTAPTAAVGDNSTKIGTTAFVQVAVRAMYPVGSLYINTSNSTNPATLFGFGTWVLFAAGRTLVCIDTSNPIMDSPEEAFGRSDAINVLHSHGVTDPSHNHGINDISGSGTGTSGIDGVSRNLDGVRSDVIAYQTTGISIQASGESGVNQNYQPSIAVYMWKRIA